MIPHWLKCWCASSQPCVMRLSDCLFSPFPQFVLFRVFLLSLLLPCGLHRGQIPLALRQLRSLPFWSIIYHSQVMNPTASTISTTQRLLKSSSRSNPATRYPRTCMTRSSMTRPLVERSLHHRSFRSEKNQRTVDKLLKKVCCQVSPSLSVM